MSADNFFLIRLHPKGGFAAPMGFASDDTDPEVADFDDQFDTFDAAVLWASNEYSEYGVSVHKECEEALARPHVEPPPVPEPQYTYSRPEHNMRRNVSEPLNPRITIPLLNRDYEQPKGRMDLTVPQVLELCDLLIQEVRSFIQRGDIVVALSRSDSGPVHTGGNT